ncbi:MAG: hypothetical protein A2Y38_16155 [Spirochaetes bacterium GWB1_59_5]|nr:MAG: hypothetical protein A2Y38_16155 [Spirochaetes bacterium GWB1_59_5]
MARYKATKDGWDGRRIIKKGQVFNFDGVRGSWMVPCDSAGNPLEGEDVPQRPLRAGAKMSTGHTREALRAKCKDLGIVYKAIMGAHDLAELIRKHEEVAALKAHESAAVGKSSENPDGGTPGVGLEGAGQGTGDQDVI